MVPLMLGQILFSPDSQYIVPGSHASKINLYNAEYRQKEEHERDMKC